MGAKGDGWFRPRQCCCGRRRGSEELISEHGLRSETRRSARARFQASGSIGTLGGAQAERLPLAAPIAPPAPTPATANSREPRRIDNQASVTVNGGTGKKFGRWTSGTITVGNGNLTFADGNTALGDDISVDGGVGTVTNMGPLRLAAPRPLPGISPRARLACSAWTLPAISRDSTGCFDHQAHDARRRPLDRSDRGLHPGEGRQLRHPQFRQPRGPGFDALALDGAACSSPGADMWTCGGGCVSTKSSTSRRWTSSWRVARPYSDRRARRPSPNHRPGRCSRWASSASAASACANARGPTRPGYGNARPRHGDSFRPARSAGSRCGRRPSGTRQANGSMRRHPTDR